MNEQNRSKLERCQAALGPCVENRHELLAGFLDSIGQPDSAAVATDAARFVPAVSAWLDSHPVSPDAAGVVLLRLATLIGETLVQRLGGQWLLDDNPASPHFANYVVGNFSEIPNPNAAINPFTIARDVVLSHRSQPAADQSPRSLVDVLGDIEAALRNA